VERMLQWSRHLPKKDREIIDAAFCRGLSGHVAAGLFGCSAAAYRRRLRRLLRRMRDPNFQFIVRHEALLPHTLRRTARLVFVHGMPLRQAADRLNVPLHELRRRVDTVRALAAI